MIRIWIAILGSMLILQTSRAAPVTETESTSKPTSHPLPGHSYGQHKGWLGPIEEPDMSILCQTCQENDAEMPSISVQKETKGDKRKATPTTASANKRPKKSPPVCPDHNTGKQRSFCIKCQLDGTGGGSLCIGGHGKRKYACKECHPDKYEAHRKSEVALYAKKRNQASINCAEHKTGRPKLHCIGCQQAGNGGGSICVGGHGREKRNCKECPPEEYVVNSIKRKTKTQKRRMAMNEASGKYDNSKDENDGKKIKISRGTSNGNESTGEKSKCVCGNEMDSMEDPICAECANNLSNILEK